jgi:hypothetical protein
MAERIPVPRFVGGTGRLKTLQASAERTINRFPESTKGLGGKVERYLRPRECLNPFAHILDTDTSAFFYQDGVLFCCCGTTFAQIFANGTSVARGTITYDADRMATMVGSGTVDSGSGGHQVMIVSSAGDVYVYDTVTLAFTQVTFDDGSPIVVAMCEFMDGYFLALALNSRRVYYSALEDALTWDFTFGYFEVSWASDNVYAIKRSGRQLWLIGSKTSEVYADTGNANSPFAPIQGALLDIGSLAPYSVQRDGETISWLSQSEHGGGLVVRASGYTPQQISTYPIAIMINQADTVGFLRLCEAFVHENEQHTFYWLHVPIIDTTPVFDFSEVEWSERAMWNTAQASWEPHIARCQAYAFERHLIGDRTSGIIYEQSFDFLSDGLL